MKPLPSLRALFASTELAATILLATSFLSPVSAALTFPLVPSPNLELSQLGRVAFVGDFAAASLFQYTQQSENAFRTNGSQGLLSRFPNTGAFATLEASDAYINAMCTLMQNGQLQGVLLGGNFTSLGGVNSPGIALYNPNSNNVTAIPGLSGKVNALYCDPSGTVYVGGMFSAANSSNAVAWTTAGFKSLPFTGFNGAVTSIVKDANQNIVFGGYFDGLGNTSVPAEQNSQRIPITIAQVSAGPTTTQAGLNNASNIVCKDPNTDGPGAAWLLADATPGKLTATMPYGFIPSLLRIGNTNYEGRGTKSWYFTATPINGIMNFSYVDETGLTQYCTSNCPLQQGNSSLQDFRFVNPVGMSGFEVDITDFYGAGGGLSDFELYENDIYAFAVNNFNEPACPGIAFPSHSQTTGTWTETIAVNGSVNYLTAQVTGSQANLNSTSVVFTPDIKQAGNYSVTIYTPGCLQDNTCTTRGQVSVSGTLASSTSNGSPSFQQNIFQTNNYDKYDQIFLGYVDATSSSFMPSITLTPAAGQNGPQTVVAQRVRFELVTSSGGLNGLFEYNPNSTTIDMNFRKSTIDSAADGLNGGAIINSMVSSGSSIFVGGNFQGSGFSNFFQIGNSTPPVANGGLNGAVQTMYQNGSIIYIGGSFNGTLNSTGPQGLSGVAAYNTNNNTWSPLGAGLSGTVNYIVPFQINLSASKNTVLALGISGIFSQILPFAGAAAIPVNNFAVWIPSQNNWLQNLNVPTISVQGILTAQTSVLNNPPLFAGSVSSYDVDSTGAVEITGPSTLEAFPVQIQSQSSSSGPSTRKRQATNSTVPTTPTNQTGVLAGLFTTANSKNLTVFAGHFAAAAGASTINNLVIIDGGNSDKLSGLPAGVDGGSTFTSVGTVSTSLFAGGALSGTVNGNPVSGMIVYDLSSGAYANPQPAALTAGPSGTVVVTAIAPQPSTQSVFVAGSFTGAGSFTCPSLCIYDSSRQQWSSPGSGFNGTITSMVWIDPTHLLIAGALSVNGTNTALSTYDSQGQYFTAASSAGAPAGSITALTPANSNGSAAWVAGTGNDGSAFLAKYNGFNWSYVNGLGANTTISALQIFTLSTPHASSSLVDSNHALMLMGRLVLPAYGSASAALFNGTTLLPYLLSATADNQPGTANGIIAANPLNFFLGGKKHLAVGFVVLIALAIALGLLFLLIAAGFLASIIRRRQLGYRPAPSSMGNPSMSENLRRAPPEELLSGVGTTSGRGWSTR
jgi:Cortical protein marker for cell polarity